MHVELPVAAIVFASLEPIMKGNRADLSHEPEGRSTMNANTRLMFLTPLVAVLLSGWCNNNETPKPGTATPTPTKILKTNAPARLEVLTGKEVTFFPGYGYRDAKGWNIHLRGWAHEPRTHANAVLTQMAKIKGVCGDIGMKNFQVRISDFDADDEASEVVIVKFDSDPEDKSYTLDKSGPDGIVQTDLVLTDDQAKQLLDKQGSSNRWLTYRAISTGHTGLGRIRLIESEPNGTSLISDIDDTIKVTEVPAGQDAIVKNVFCREYQPLPEMAERYRVLGDIPVHYVSGGPDQLFGPIYDFFIAGPGGFPEGSFHLRFFPKNLRLSEGRKNLRQLGVSTLDATYKHKIKEITTLMKNFPDRKFILVGDSGEVDPEVYSRIRSERPAQVKAIWIRDVINDDETNHFRLEGMEVIKVNPPVCVQNKHFINLSARIKESYPTKEYKRNTAPPCDKEAKKT